MKSAHLQAYLKLPQKRQQKIKTQQQLGHLEFMDKMMGACEFAKPDMSKKNSLKIAYWHSLWSDLHSQLPYSQYDIIEALAPLLQILYVCSCISWLICKLCKLDSY